MNTKSLLTRTVIVFVALASAGVIVAVSAQAVADITQQIIIAALGSAMFGAALSFFLVRLFSLIEK